MTGIFRANNPLNTFLLLIYGIILKLDWFLHPQIPQIQNSNGFLFDNFLNWVRPYFETYPTSYFIVSYLLLFTQAVSFNQVIISRRLMQKPNYLPAMSFLLITSFFSEWNVLSAPLVANTFLIWVWSRVSNLNNNQHPKSALLNIGFAIGISSFFYLPSLAFAALVIMALIISRPPKAAEWLITLIGIITPWYFVGAWLFLTNKLYSFQLNGLAISYSFPESLTIRLIGIATILVLTIAGGFLVQSFGSKQVVQVRKNWTLMMLYLIVGLAALFITKTYRLEYWLIVLVPASAFIGATFFYPRLKWMAAILQWAMVGFVVYVQYFSN